MTYYYNNYGLFTIINILGNLSFKDLFQYSVFPLLYKYKGVFDDKKKVGINERDLSLHAEFPFLILQKTNIKL